MKLLKIAFLLLTPSAAFAVYPVYDKLNHVQTVKSVATLAEQVKKTQEQISNQLRQIEEAKKLFTTTASLTAQIGDWKGVLDNAKSLQLQVKQLTEKPAFSFDSAFKLDYSTSPLSYTGNGLYEPLSNKNALGQDVVIDKIKTARYAAVEQASAKLDTYLKTTDEQLLALRKETGETYEQMNKPGLTQAEQTKLAQKADSLNSRVRDIQNDRLVSIQRVQLQHDLNQNQKEKEEAVAEKVNEDNYGKLRDAYKQTGSGIRR